MLSDPKYVRHVPWLSVFLIDAGQVGQIYRMWVERSALGQNLWSWVAVGLALVGWLQYYRVMLPKEKASQWCTAFSILVVLVTITSVIYWRNFA